nr:protein FANTASTIC FOUR 3-like [Ipomoea batatas]
MPSLLENVGDINAKCDDDICGDNFVQCFDSFDSDDDDKNCFDTCENNYFVSLDDNDVLESFTFDDESVSNELTNDLHEICGDNDVNIEASLCDLNDIECVTFHDNCLDDALYIHDLIGKDRSEGVENENVKEEVEDKKKTRNESVREQVDEKLSETSLKLCTENLGSETGTDIADTAIFSSDFLPELALPPLPRQVAAPRNRNKVKGKPKNFPPPLTTLIAPNSLQMPSDEIGVKEHDNFCDEPYDDSFDHNCGDAYIENVVGNVDCVVDNVHANLLENVGDINAKCDDDICDNSSNACKNATYDLHDIVLKYRNDFGVTNEVNCFNPYDFNDSDSFDSDDDDKNCFDTCENNYFVSLDDNDVLESFTFDDESVSNELTNDLHEICGDNDVNIEASLCDLNDIECVTFHDNCLDDALYIHDLIGKDRSEGVENENVKEEVEDKKKTRNESVREQVFDEKKSHIIETATLKLKLSSPRCIDLGGWGFLQSLPNTSREKGKQPIYVHPLSKQYSSYYGSKLSETSLKLCTENLGSETGTDIADTAIFSSDFLPELALPPLPRQVAAPRNRNKVKGKPKNFPPPLTTLIAPNSLQRAHQSMLSSKLSVAMAASGYLFWTALSFALTRP